MFTFTQKVLFRHCDPAGIVFYPRYVEMINDCVEAFFEQRLDWPFHQIHPDGWKVPTASISIDFRAPSRHGETLELALRVLRIGRTSITLEITASCGGELRFRSESVLVHVGPEGRPVPLPETVRAALAAEMEDAT